MRRMLFLHFKNIYSFGRQDLFYIFYPCAKMTSINVMFTLQRKKKKIPVCFTIFRYRFQSLSLVVSVWKTCHVVCFCLSPSLSCFDSSTWMRLRGWWSELVGRMYSGVFAHCLVNHFSVTGRSRSCRLLQNIYLTLLAFLDESCTLNRICHDFTKRW